MLVENHPVDSHAVAPATVPFQGDGPQIEGKTEAKVDMEPKVEVKMDPQIEGKEEEAKLEAAKLQAMVESKEAPQPVALNKSPDKEDKQETMKTPDETPKIPPQQRSDAKVNESNDNSTTISESIQKNISKCSNIS